MPNITVTEGGWYRDAQDRLFMDAEPIKGTPNFWLHRSGTPTRVYTPDGVYLDAQGNPSVSDFNLVLAIDRPRPPSVDPALNDVAGVYL